MMFSFFKLASILLASCATAVLSESQGLARMSVTERGIAEDGDLPLATFKNCIRGQEIYTEISINNARMKQAKVIEYLQHLEGKKITDRAWRPFTRRFGKPTEQEYRRVREVFEQLPNQPLTPGTYTCGSPLCRRLGGPIIPVPTGDSNDVILCDEFWTLPRNKKESPVDKRTRLLIHEWVRRVACASAPAVVDRYTDFAMDFFLEFVPQQPLEYY